MCLADPATFHENSVELVVRSAVGELAQRLGALPCRRIYVPGVDAPGGAPAVSIEAVSNTAVEVHPLGPSGHWPFIDQADDFAALLTRWLRQGSG